MSYIDKDLISNKTSCYIFDIDGCLADVDHLLLTREEAFNKEMEAFNTAQSEYQSDCIKYEEDLKQYKKGLLTMRPSEPVLPVKPQSIDPAKKDKWDAEYFYKHLDQALPIGGVIDLFIALALTKKVIILTGRNESSRVDTINWLSKAVTERSTSDMFRRMNFQTIFKPDKDKGTTEKFKRDKVLELAKQYNIQLIVDDAPKNIEEFTKLGFLALTPNRIYKEV